MYDCPSTNSSRNSRPMMGAMSGPAGTMNSGFLGGAFSDPSSMIALLIIAASFFKK